MEYRAIVHTGKIDGSTIIDLAGISIPSEVPVVLGFGDRQVVGKASSFEKTPDGILATIVSDVKGLSPAISGQVIKKRSVGGIQIVDKFDLQSIGLVPSNQTDTEPLGGSGSKFLDSVKAAFRESMDESQRASEDQRIIQAFRNGVMVGVVIGASLSSVGWMVWIILR